MSVSPKVLTYISKAVSYLLRHGAEKEGVKIESNGNVQMNVLIQWLKDKHNIEVTTDIIRDIVKTDTKGRYTISIIDSNEYIRANQGHSIEVEELNIKPIGLEDVEYYSMILHGTYKENYENIKKSGLSKMSRQHIHMVCLANPDAFKLMRANVNMYISINMKKAIEDNIPFYISNNGVILSSGNSSGLIPPKYLTFLEKSPHNCPCVGCLVVGIDMEYNLYIAIVKTPKGHMSFPKGKLEKGEHSIQGALRETEEETGITHNELYFWDFPLLLEKSSNGNNATCYYVAIYKKVITPFSKLIPSDPDELDEAKWIPYDKIINWENDDGNTGNLLDRRIDIARQLPVNDILTYILQFNKL